MGYGEGGSEKTKFTILALTKWPINFLINNLSVNLLLYLLTL